MNIQYREPVLTLSNVPFVAGTILVRHEMRLRRQREKARRRAAFRDTLGRWRGLLFRSAIRRSAEPFRSDSTPAIA